MNKKLIPLVTISLIIVGWAGFAYIPNDNYGEGTHSSAHDSEEQVYFGTEDKDPMTLECDVVKLPEHPTRPQSAVALREASEKVLTGCVAIRWGS